jgi:nucleoid-associated protein YgaU
MSLFSLRRLPLTAIACAVLFSAMSACSSSHPSGEASSGNPDATPDSGTSQSNADQVGSVPEDMLSDEKGVEASGTAVNPEATAADPFGDLKEKVNPAEKAQEKKEELAAASEEKVGGDPFKMDEPAGSSPGSGKIERYTVKAGDTLMKIAFNLYGDVNRWKDLNELNQEALKGNTGLRKGMKLRYDAPVESFSPEQLAHSYEIKKGDTLAGIADDVYGKKMKYKKLQAYNKHLIKNPNRIFAGFTIYYDVTQQEIADAEARKAQKAAGGGSNGSQPSSIPSAISPPSGAKAAHLAVSPSASDSSAIPGPGAVVGPPVPTQQ